VESDPIVGSRRRKVHQKLRSMNAEDGDEVTIFRRMTVPTEQPRREYNTREQGHKGNYFTHSRKLATGY